MGSEMCIRDSRHTKSTALTSPFVFVGIDERSTSKISVLSVHSYHTIFPSYTNSHAQCDTSSPTPSASDHEHDDCPTAPPSAESSYVCSLFYRDPTTGFLKITRNLHAQHVWVPRSMPTYFPCAEKGFATFISISPDGPLHSDGNGLIVALENVSDEQFSDRLKSGVPYSFRMKADRSTTVRMGVLTSKSLARRQHVQVSSLVSVVSSRTPSHIMCTKRTVLRLSPSHTWTRRVLLVRNCIRHVTCSSTARQTIRLSASMPVQASTLNIPSQVE